MHAHHKTYDVIGYVFFYSSVFVNSIMFCRISVKWPALAAAVEATEEADPLKDTTVTSRCNRAVVVIATLALTEHLLMWISKVARLSDCYPEPRRSYQTFIHSNYPFVFELGLPFSLPLAFALQYVTFITTMNWNYSDVFIICISYYLRARFQQLNNKINDAKGKYVGAWFWRRARSEYTRLVELVHRVDDVISPVVFVSFASNLFFICFQLYYSIAIFFGYERETYLVFSVTLLLLRSVAVSLIAAGVHSATLEPAAALYSVPSPVFCIEFSASADRHHGDPGDDNSTFFVPHMD
ncbi:hypothetical protein JYU34_011153 [Plutella xylostella]|uniref:Gustatory receptor n=1 Tax=Plutella xylostella TaxID=51655 RepID=A0ABQ7QHH5_PLUXY|nr:hypothetical protein JYU34_011153 [Plutella xylostella]